MSSIKLPEYFAFLLNSSVSFFSTYFPPALSGHSHRAIVDWEPYLLDCTVDEQGRAILQKAVCQDDLMCLKYGEHGQQMIQALDKVRSPFRSFTHLPSPRDADCHLFYCLLDL